MKMKATSKTFRTDKAFKDRCVVVVDSFSRNNFLEKFCCQQKRFTFLKNKSYEENL